MWTLAQTLPLPHRLQPELVLPLTRQLEGAPSEAAAAPCAGTSKLLSVLLMATALGVTQRELLPPLLLLLPPLQLQTRRT